MAKFCTNCGKELLEGMTFCTECGTPAPLSNQETPVAEPAEAVAVVPEGADAAAVPESEPVEESTPQVTAADMALEEQVPDTALEEQVPNPSLQEQVPEEQVTEASLQEQTPLAVQSAQPIPVPVVPVQQPQYAPQGQQAAGQPQYAPQGQQAAGQPQYAPQGQQAAGQPQYAPQGQQAAGQPQYAPQGQQVAGQPQYAPQGQPLNQTQQLQQNLYGQQAAQQRVVEEDARKTSVMGTGAFFGLMFVFAIPVIGWIICIILAIAPKNQNLKHFARATLIWIIIGLVLVGILVAFIFVVGGAVKDFVSNIFGGELGSIQDIFSNLTEELGDLG